MANFINLGKERKQLILSISKSKNSLYSFMSLCYFPHNIPILRWFLKKGSKINGDLTLKLNGSIQGWMLSCLPFWFRNRQRWSEALAPHAAWRWLDYLNQGHPKIYSNWIHQAQNKMVTRWIKKKKRLL